VTELLERLNPGPTQNIFRTLAHNPRVTKRFGLFVAGLLGKGSLPARERELVILRMGWRCGSVYEFGQHTVIGRAAGLTHDEIVAVTLVPDQREWSDLDRDLIALADELYDGNTVSDATWARLAARWSEAQLIELLMLAGVYWMVSGFLNSTGVELEPGAPGWPADRQPPQG
jgi:alkylhydroperoxidase family enzyme